MLADLQRLSKLTLLVECCEFLSKLNIFTSLICDSGLFKRFLAQNDSKNRLTTSCLICQSVDDGPEQ
ncbi:hypothetical protein AT746_01530 [Lacimicrobium alkaliphilum]|uniref:Uncharacterized protein n=1 Tax=Lacimicrobium alkaliphilum TaxID=1526571 RepID=A0A0U3AGB4_9ALTE|nr:hypothetical protein AT746_01530 [Lacimicrobium alkaliphilum]